MRKAMILNKFRVAYIDDLEEIISRIQNSEYGYIQLNDVKNIRNYKDAIQWLLNNNIIVKINIDNNSNRGFKLNDLYFIESKGGKE